MANKAGEEAAARMNNLLEEFHAVLDKVTPMHSGEVMTAVVAFVGDVFEDCHPTAQNVRKRLNTIIFEFNEQLCAETKKRN